MKILMRWFAWFLFCCAGSAAAADAPAASQGTRDDIAGLSRNYPAGSITSRELADRALTDSTRAEQAVQAAFAAQRVRCADVFLVNHCLDAARRVARDGEREIRRVGLEAHDLQRHLAAQEHARSRAEEQRREAADELQRPEREREARAAAQAREDNAAARAQDARQDPVAAAQARADSDAKLRTHDRDLEAKDAVRRRQEADSVRAFDEKQTQAAEYAQTRARDKAANEKRRAERKTERDAQEAAQPQVDSVVPSEKAH